MTDPAGPGVLLLDAQLAVTRRIPLPVREVHDLALREGGREPLLFVVDPGIDAALRQGQVATRWAQGNLRVMTPAGEERMVIGPPPIRIHTVHRASFRPTAVALANPGSAAPSDIWLADGYGTSLVHRFSGDGTYRQTISGEEGRAGAFRNPHALLTREHRGEQELVIADRHNSRLQVYDLEGRFKRAISDERVVTPSALASHGGRLYIAELQGGIVVLDERDRYMTTLIERTTPIDAAWPNAVVDGSTRRAALVRGRFQAPHAIAVSTDGSILVAEWVPGGRLTLLEPVA